MAKMASLQAEQTTIQFLTESQWDEIYQPVNDSLLNVYGEDLRTVRIMPENNVWTLVEGDKGLSIINGYHLVNRIGYYITKQPWEHGESIIIELEEN